MSRVLITGMLLLMGSCTSGDDSQIEDHVWKQQTDTLDRAREATQLLEDAANKKRKQIDQQTQ
jgi:hypothetical protein